MTSRSVPATGGAGLAGARPTMVVLRALGLGDFLTAVPALRALCRARPDHRLVLAAPAALAPLADFSRAVDLIHPTASLDDFVAPEEPVDIAVNLHGRGPQSHRVLTTTAPREFLAFECPDLGSLGPDWRADEHEVHRWCRLVAEGWGAEADPTDLALRRPIRSSAAPGAVVVSPGASHESRRWPAERYAEVARRLHEDGHEVVLTGNVEERPLADAVRRWAGLPRESCLAGRTDLAGLAAVVADAQLVVCGDTGVAHLASAYRTPSVVLFGSTPPSRWGPPADGPHVPIWHGTGEGDPRRDPGRDPGRDPEREVPDPALLRIEVDEVLEQAVRLLTGSAGAPEVRAP